MSGLHKPPVFRPARRRGLAALWAGCLWAGGLALGAGLWSGPAAASRDDDHERARRAMQAGEVMPLPRLLERVKRSHPGDVLEVELEREDGRWQYEVKLIQPDGLLLKLWFDARTGALLGSRQRRKDRKHDDD